MDLQNFEYIGEGNANICFALNNNLVARLPKEKMNIFKQLDFIKTVMASLLGQQYIGAIVCLSCNRIEVARN